jgi:3-methylcrotonyl-CoA carboxylase alpha subunit
MGGGSVIRSLLVANRGEIALRIARTCREMGIRSILASADDDLESRAASFFDSIAPLGEGDSRETYLNVSRIIDAARASGADALHPGYGFLSEKAELAAACREAGIVFVGPRPETISTMGSKAESRKLMERLGVPVIPGYHGADQSEGTLMEEARRIGFPLLVKASAGGGGKGMKVVRGPEELMAAIHSARREALAAFGDETLLLERYLEQPRHIEFQIFGDSHGKLVHLFERDCSVQRRHQKVIEESPASHLDDGLRQRMAASALEAAGGIGYQNAGTVEFILTPEGEYYFLEMNTRLQVEHPVTELVTGFDLVRAQLDVAGGAPLPWTQEQLSQRGHAIECRIYAEDPDRGFLPQTGRVSRYREPGGPGVRVDSGIAAGSEVTIRYDPLLAKLIVHAEDRPACIQRLLRALEEFVILGTTTNIAWLRRVVGHQLFRDGKATTAFLAENEAKLTRGSDPAAALVAAVVSQKGSRAEAAERQPASAGAPSVWNLLGEWGRPA